MLDVCRIAPRFAEAGYVEAGFLCGADDYRFAFGDGAGGLRDLFRHVEWHHYCTVLVGVNEVAIYHLHACHRDRLAKANHMNKGVLRADPVCQHLEAGGNIR